MSILDNIYGLASTTLYIRSQLISPSDTKYLLERLSLAFTKEQYKGSYFYEVYKSKPNLLKSSGFNGNQEWVNIENLIEGDRKTQLGLSSLIYSMSVFPNLDPKYQEYYINKLNYYINSGNSVPYIPYLKINQIYNSFSLTNLNSEIAKSPKDFETRVVNYNWYDAEPLFSDPASDLSLTQRIKDSENQYYYLRGEIIYDFNIGHSKCQKNKITISTPTGEIQTYIYDNLPCFEEETFVGPVTGIKFNRIFNDGPPSSGYFDSGTMQSYINFDENVLDKKDYFSNKQNLFSFYKDNLDNYVFLKSGFQLDAQGPISSIGEYGNGRTNWITDEEGCRWTREDLETLPLMRMHQGDNLPKYHYYKIRVSQNECLTGINGPLNWTGLKFANFELKDDWLNYFKYTNTNPRLDKQRFLKRALNIENYLDETVFPNQIHSPYLNVVDTGDGDLFCNNYIAYPQLNENYSTLPGFAFYQTFDNLSFGSGLGTNKEEFLSINIYPSFSKSNFSLTNSKSNRSIEISKFPIFTGRRNDHSIISNSFYLEINKKFNSSSMNDYDDIFKKVLSIGDNFNNGVSGSSSLQSNAGYIYTGYKIIKNGEKIQLEDLLSEYENKKIGQKYSKIKFITGYLETGTNLIYETVPLTAHIAYPDENGNLKNPGDYIVYYYLNNQTGENSLLAFNSGWTENFAPIPKGVLDNQDKYTPLYGYQKVENYFPRYYSGPFAVYENKFLYPNANEFYKKYKYLRSGFPYKISYVINVREENAREIFADSGFFGGVSYKNVIRASGLPFDSFTNNQNENVSVSDLKVLMVDPFSPISTDQSLIEAYDYYTNTGLYKHPRTINVLNGVNSFYYGSNFQDNKEYVDSFYVPSVDYCLQDNLNNELINSHAPKSEEIFNPYVPDISFLQEQLLFGAKDYSYNFNPTFIQGIKVTGKIDLKKIKFRIGDEILETEIPFINKRSDGLFWGYFGRQLSGQMFYSTPLFDLSLLNKNVNDGLKSGILKNLSNFKSSAQSAFSNNGFVEDGSLYENNVYNGKDPLFYEYIGGRIGEGADFEGGYHNLGLIGDSWYSYNNDFFKNGPNTYIGNPISDSYTFLTFLNSGNLNIYSRNLAFYPYYSNWKYKQLDSSFNLDQIELTPILVGEQNYYNFNLKQYFNLKEVNGAEGEFYYSSGFTIGPFSQDVELCVLSGNSIIPSGNLYIDGKIIAGNGPFPEKLKDRNQDIYYNNVINLMPFSGGISPESPYTGGGINTVVRGNKRNPNLTTFKLIPSGGSININISGKENIGFNENAIVTIRPRTAVFGVSFHDQPLEIRQKTFDKISGDFTYLEGCYFINNGTESRFSFPINGDVTSLIGKKFEYITNPNITYLFPKPPSEDFDQTLSAYGILEYDRVGNKIYNTARGPTFEYWRIKNPDLIFEILRDATRISFEIESINIEYGDIPYQSQKIIIPSGDCTISGVFGYTGQAESALISQGIYISGISGARVFSEVFNPHYVSDILKRLPSQIEKLPSGFGTSPILEAPSYIKTRENYFYISGGDKYINASPSFSLNYNKFIWPAKSDLALLNPDVVYEQFPPDDGSIFPNSYIYFSASQGQILTSGISGKRNPIENVTYKTNFLYSFIDSVSTNSIYNTGKCIFKSIGKKEFLDSGSLTGILIPDGVPLSLKNFV